MIWPIKRYGCDRPTGKHQSSPACELGFSTGLARLMREWGRSEFAVGAQNEGHEPPIRADLTLFTIFSSDAVVAFSHIAREMAGPLFLAYRVYIA
jgi:hypothetical protein